MGAGAQAISVRRVAQSLADNENQRAIERILYGSSQTPQYNAGQLRRSAQNLIDNNVVTAGSAQNLSSIMQGLGGLGGAGGLGGIFASPTVVTPQQTPNAGLPMMQSPMTANRGDIASYLNQLRQGMPIGGYSPLLPRTTMMPQIAPQQPPAAQPPMLPQNQNIDAIMMANKQFSGNTPPYNPNQRMGLF